MLCVYAGTESMRLQFPLLMILVVLVLAVLVTYSRLMCVPDLKNNQPAGNVHTFAGLFLELAGLQNLKKEGMLLNLDRFLKLSLL